MSCSGWGRAWSAGRTLAGHPRAAHRPTPCRCLAAGLRGGKTIPEQVAAHPQVFATLTAPSYGPVHGRRSSTATHCRCGHTHPKGDPALGTPLDPDRYDYTGAVLWNAHAPALWARFMLQLRRTITAMAGIPQRLLSRYAQVSYAKVAEYQRRGLIHFHAVIRLDGSQGGSTPPPSWATPELLAAAIRTAATLACVDGQDIDRRSYSFTFGDQIDTKIIQSSTFEGGTTITEGKVAGYVAKYATKGTEGATGTLDHRIKLIAELAQEDLPDHAARMIRTTWTLGALHLARAAWPRRHTPAPGLSTLVLALWVFDGIGLTPDLENLAALVSGPVRREGATADA